jgi:glucose/arabinose dehydrogenase
VKRAGLAFLAILIMIGAVVYARDRQDPQTGQPVNQTTGTGDIPSIQTEVIAQGLFNVWDVAEAPDKTLFYTERDNKIGAVLQGKSQTIYQGEDVVVGGEGGMMGMTLDPDFDQNRYLYACYNTASDIRVVRFTVAADNLSLSTKIDIITDMPVNPGGRHSGCRPRFSPENYLWVGTGDTARSEHPQAPGSLGGKILKVDRFGKAAPDNLGSPFDTRIHSYGHRNTQGIAFYPQPRNGVIGYSTEHGPTKDDEINVLEKGNFGWDPGSGYNENVPMTNRTKFPDAIPSVWSSGNNTIAVSGAAILTGTQWKSWENRLVVAVQKDKHVRLINFDNSGKKVISEDKILDSFGRIRSVVMGNDNSLYLTTDNGSGKDEIIRVSAK